MVKAEWEAVTYGDSPIDKWQKIIRHLRRFLRGWTKNLSGNYKKEKECLLATINDLDLKAECASLSSAERVWLREANEKLTLLGGMKRQNGLKREEIIQNIFI
jgi:hypothetical protein